MFPIFYEFVLFLILRRSTVTLGSGRPPIYTGVSLDGMIGVGPELAQAQCTFAGAPEVAQAPAILRRTSVSLRHLLGCF